MAKRKRSRGRRGTEQQPQAQQDTMAELTQAITRLDHQLFDIQRRLTTAKSKADSLFQVKIEQYKQRQLPKIQARLDQQTVGLRKKKAQLEAEIRAVRARLQAVEIARILQEGEQAAIEDLEEIGLSEEEEEETDDDEDVDFLEEGID